MAKDPKNWLPFHNRNVINEAVGNWNDITAGMICRFNYKGEYATIKRPLVFVLNPRWRGHFHAIALDYISDDVLEKLKKLVEESIGEKARKLTGLRLNLLKADIRDPRKFYETRLKKFIKTYFPPNKSPYRTYLRANIKNLRQIDYRFRDFSINSTGENV